MSYINKDFFENAENQQKAMQINWEIADCLHQFGKLPCNGFPLVPYLLHKASQYSNPFGITLQAITDGKIEVNEDVRFMAKEVLTEVSDDGESRAAASARDEILAGRICSRCCQPCHG